MQFAEMAKEMAMFDSGTITLELFLQNCPDLITHLFDRCMLIKSQEVGRALVAQMYDRPQYSSTNLALCLMV